MIIFWGNLYQLWHDPTESLKHSIVQIHETHISVILKIGKETSSLIQVNMMLTSFDIRCWYSEKRAVNIKLLKFKTEKEVSELSLVLDLIWKIQDLHMPKYDAFIGLKFSVCSSFSCLPMYIRMPIVFPSLIWKSFMKMRPAICYLYEHVYCSFMLINSSVFLLNEDDALKKWKNFSTGPMYPAC
jgi:hypothetical protein